MSRRRSKNDGLPARVYQRYGKRWFSVYFKAPDGTRVNNLHCDVTDKASVDRLRREMTMFAASYGADGGRRKDTVQAAFDAWFEYQASLPETSGSKRASSTLAENRREARALCKVFGELSIHALVPSDASRYLDACERKGRAAKGNKEVSLMRLVLGYQMRLGVLNSNPFVGIRQLPTVKRDRLVSGRELMLALQVGRELGGPAHIVALALMTSYLCVRRSVEVRAMTRDQVTEAGITWIAAKRKKTDKVLEGLIEWSPRLKRTIEEALAVERHAGVESHYVFGNLKGARYTKGGWKKTLSVLMGACVKRAAGRKGGPMKFEPFSLQDCRPMAVSARMHKHSGDVTDATLHRSRRMVDEVYDRRRLRIAKATT